MGCKRSKARALDHVLALLFLVPHPKGRYHLASGRGLIVKTQGLDKIVESTCRELSLEFQDNIYDKYGKILTLLIVVHWRLIIR